MTFRCDAAEELGKMGALAESAVPDIIDLLKNGDIIERQRAYTALGRIRDTRAVLPVIEGMEKEEWGSRNTLQRAAEALGRLGDARAMEPLLRLLARRPPAEVVFEACESLVKIIEENQDQFVSIISTSDGANLVAEYFVPYLGRVEFSPELEKQLVPELLRLVNAEEEAVRASAIRIFRRLKISGQDEQAGQALVAALSDTSPTVRLWAIKLLPGVAIKEEMPRLLAALTSPDPRFRRAAASALGRMDEGTPEVLNALVRSLADEDRDLRVVAAYALGYLKAEQAVEPLLNLLRSSEDAALWAAIQALGEIGDPRAVEALVHALDHEHPGVVHDSIIALGKLGDATALPRLERLLDKAQDLDGSVRYDLLRSIGKLKGQDEKQIALQAIYHPDSSIHGVRYHAVDNLIHMGPDAYDELFELIENPPDSHILGECASTLGRVEDPRTLNALIKLTRNSNNYVVWQAVLGLASLASKEAVKPLIDVLGQDREDSTYRYSIGNTVPDALFELTGRNFGEEHKVWVKWWRREGNAPFFRRLF